MQRKILETAKSLIIQQTEVKPSAHKTSLTPRKRPMPRPVPNAPHYGSRSTCVLQTRWVIAAQIIGATVAYWLLGENTISPVTALGLALLLGISGPVKHFLEHLLKKYVRNLPKCRHKPAPLFVSIMLAAFLGAALIKLAEHHLPSA